MMDAETAAAPTRGPTPICAIGASAGGITALQHLFGQLPPDLGLAYVVILHLAPDHPSSLREILSSCTRMPVASVDDTPTLLPDHVFVIPPDRELVIEGDSVTARPFTEPRGQRAPIDMFFRSVAAARGDGIAVVLSGAGADGSLGVRSTKEGGGVIMVQDPAEAEFASMPQNAIATGLADIVAPIARLAERLAEIARSKEAVRSLDTDRAANDLRRIVAFLRGRLGHDFSSYKRATVMRRVGRRMQVCRCDTLAAYADYLLTTPEESKELFSDLLISVTMFFRDPHAFQALDHRVMPTLFDELRPEADEGIRAWVVGCATGEEAYAVAMLLHEEAARRRRHPQVQVFATDLDEGALATAREGRYPRSIEADVSEERLNRFFIDEGTHYRVRKELRESVLFATHSVIREPPFMRLDLISCRNLLIYLERSQQQHLCSIFHYALKPGRFLFLGSAETADVAADLFTPLDRDARIYGARPHAAAVLPVVPQFAAAERSAIPAPTFPERTERAGLPTALHMSALERSAPPSVLVDDGHNILHLSPSAGRFMLHSGGPVSNQLPVVVRPELRLDLRLALARALDNREPTLTHPVVVSMDGGDRRVAMHVAPVANADHMGAQALVLFLDGGAAPAADEPETLSDAGPDELRRLHAELKTAHEALVASRTGHETSIQDLRATNEELQSINEEYRSTAEELETSKEELQSINEELHTVNAELKSKLGSISTAHSNLQNLATATEIGTLFLDSELRIRMFTRPIAELFNVTEADVGRPITDFTHRLDYDGLEADARRVLRDLVPIETEIRGRNSQWFSVRLRPYRTVEDRIDGTVVTFVDITARRDAEAALRESEEQYRILFDSIDEGFCTIEVLFDAGNDARDYRFLHANPAFERQTGLSGAIGRTAREMVPDLEESWFETYGRIVRTGEPARFENRAEALGRWFDVFAFRIGRPEENRVAVLFRDVLERKRVETALREGEERFRAFVTASSDAVYQMGPDWTELRQLQGRAFLRDTDEPSGSWLDRHVHPADRSAVREAVDQATRTGTIFEMEHRVIRADGSLGWTLSRAVPIRGEDGRIREWLRAATDITDRVQALEALRESEALRRVALAGGRMGTWRWHLRDRLVRGDSQFMAFWGFPPSDEPLALSLFTDRMTPAGMEEMEAIVSKAIGHGEEFDGSLEIVSGPTAGRWIRWRGRAAPDDTSVLYGVTFDITEQKQAETRLRESEEQLRQFGEASQDVLWIRDAETFQWTYLTPAFETIYGLDRATALAGDNMANWADLVLPEDRDRAVGALKRVRDGEWVTFEYRIRRPTDGGIRWVRNTDFPIADETGRIVRFGGVGQDVTALKAAESAVADSEDRLRTLMEGVPQMIWRAGADGGWTWCGPQWTAFTGQTVAESAGFGWLAVLHPQDRDAATAAWNRALAEGSFQVEQRIRHAASGQYHWFQTRGSPIRNGNGRIVEWLGASTDIDDQVRAREVLKRSGAELERQVAERTGELMAVEEQLRQSEKLTAIGQLTGGIAHDFNNMLQGLGSSLELIRHEVAGGRTTALGGYIDRAEETAERAATLVRRLLAFSRQQELEPRALDLDRIVLGMDDLIRRSVGASVQVELQLQSGAWLVWCDPGQLENALLNLCINARDAMPDGGWLTVGTEEVELSAERAAARAGARAGRYASLFVRDTGTGIPAGVLERVFEPFFTTKEVGQGTGLGLSQVYGFVRQSGGFVEVDTDTEPGPQRGTTIRLRFPFHSENPEAPGTSAAPSAGPTVLLAEDDPGIRQLAADFLRHNDFRVLEAENGAAAARLIESGVAIDVLVTDQSMPGGMTGLQLVQLCRQRRPTLPSLLTSGFVDLPAEPDVRVLRKPYKLSRLLEMIREHLPPDEPT